MWRRCVYPAMLAALVLLGAGAARAEDMDTCFDAKGDPAIAACTRAIMSGRFTGAGLASLYYNRAFENDSKGDYDAALKDYDQAIRLNPKDSYFTNRAATYFHKKDYDGALADLTEALKINAAYAPALFGRGNVRKAKGDQDGAIADYTEALRQRPDFVYALTGRGDAYLLKGDYDRAIADFDAALKLQPDNKFAQEKRQIALEKAGRKS